jgi:hypothetical protein
MVRRRRFGLAEIPDYYPNPVAGTVCLAKQLGS